MHPERKASVGTSDKRDLHHKPKAEKVSGWHCRPLAWDAVFAPHQLSETQGGVEGGRMSSTPMMYTETINILG